MSHNSDSQQQRIESLEEEVAALKRSHIARGIRKRSSTHLFGLPLYDIACGPDPGKNEIRGHARGFFALGDIATGVFAVGGLARGIVAVGGLAIGVVSIGGCAIALLAAFGGFALGALAMGGAAIGIVAVGGGAVGYYACGGGAIGKYVISGAVQDAEAVQFFRQFQVPGVN
jgi:hypothetical protein